MRILISAGEASGDMYGAQLMGALRARVPAIEFFGVGGPAMRSAGCRTVVDSEDLAVVGIWEIVGHLPKLLRRFRALTAAAEKTRPDLAVVIDSPAFNWRVARHMRRLGVPVVYYVCPQFWAWRQGRVRLLRRYVNRALVIFPFEEKFYRDRGVDATFVGHPLADLPGPAQSRSQYAAQHQLDPAKRWITLMPGSRVKEVAMNLPTLLASAARLGEDYEFLLPVAPTLERSYLESFHPGKTVHLVEEALGALANSRAGIIASGTATVEAAMMGTPFVMVYRVTRFTYFLGRRTVKVPYFAMVNLIAGKRVVPELIQQDFTAENVARELQAILDEGPSRGEMTEELGVVRRRLHGSGQDGAPAADRAAEAILKLARAAG